jgi:hypothetical protein
VEAAVIRSPAELRQSEHDALERQYQEWLAAGNAPTVYPRGVSGDSLTPRQRLNPPVVTKGEREARQARDASIAPTRPRERAPKEPAPKRFRLKSGPEFAQAGTQKARILQLLAAGPLRSEEIAERLGIKVTIVRANLQVLKDRCRVTTSGHRRALLWSVCR